MTEETTGGWAKRDWFPTNHFRWNKNTKKPPKATWWRAEGFAKINYRLEQLWELRPLGEVAPFLKEWRNLPFCNDGFETGKFQPIPFKEGDI